MTGIKRQEHRLFRLLNTIDLILKREQLEYKKSHLMEFRSLDEQALSIRRYLPNAGIEF